MSKTKYHATFRGVAGQRLLDQAERTKTLRKVHGRDQQHSQTNLGMSCHGGEGCHGTDTCGRGLFFAQDWNLPAPSVFVESIGSRDGILGVHGVLACATSVRGGVVGRVCVVSCCCCCYFSILFILAPYALHSSCAIECRVWVCLCLSSAMRPCGAFGPRHRNECRAFVVSMPWQCSKADI